MDSRSRDFAFVILASVFWGSSFPVTKVLVGSVDPLFVTAARLGLGALLGFLILALLKRLDFGVFRRPIVWVLGVLNALAFNLQNFGMVYTTASKTSLLVNVNIVFIAILMALVFHERVTWKKVVGILVGIVGVVVLATQLNTKFLQGGEFLGDALVFLSGVVWAFYVIGTKSMVDRGGDYIALTTGILAVTTIVAIIPLIVFAAPIPTGGTLWAGILYLGFVPTFTPLLLYTLSMRTISPTISGLLVLLEVVVASLASFFFLGDPIGSFTLIGGALILAGTYIVTIGEKEIPEPGAAGLAPVPQDTAVPGPNGITRR
ncbi:MAG: DMT family transporter [Candidatus Thermoplasmatota archaeon]